MKSHFIRHSAMSRNAQVGVKKLSKKQFTKLVIIDSKNGYCFVCGTPFSSPPKMLSFKVYAHTLGGVSATNGDLLLCNGCARYKSDLTKVFIASECIDAPNTSMGGLV